MLAGLTFNQLVNARNSILHMKGGKSDDDRRQIAEFEFEMKKIVDNKLIERADGCKCVILTGWYVDNNKIKRRHLGTINELTKDVEYKEERVDVVLVTLDLDGSQKRYIYPKEVELLP